MSSPMSSSALSSHLFSLLHSLSMYIHLDSPNLGFPYFNFYGEAQRKKITLYIYSKLVLSFYVPGQLLYTLPLIATYHTSATISTTTSGNHDVENKNQEMIIKMITMMTMMWKTLIRQAASE